MGEGSVKMADEETETKPNVGGETKENQINLKVVGPANQEVHFRVKKTTALRKLMTAYCERQGQDVAALEFLFDGDRLRPEQTPEELEMEDGDSIDAMVKQVGGALAF